MLTSQQILQSLSVALTQVKTGNISENLLNHFPQMIHSLD